MKGLMFVPKLKDLAGQKFGRLTVIERAESKGKKTYWLCRCDCGAMSIVSASNLKSGKIKSCGCLNREKVIERNTKHGMKHTSIYNVWCGIKERCFNKNHKYYKYYGGRNITVVSEWLDDFQAFYNYVSKLPHFGEKGYSLDRIDNDGNYEPGNVRWADRKTQSYNRCNNIFVEYKGKKMTLAEASELSGINYGTLQSRYRRGDRGEKLFRQVKHK